MTTTHMHPIKKRYKKINIYSPSHTNTLAALCPVKEGLQFWSHRARSQFPHVSSLGLTSVAWRKKNGSLYGAYLICASQWADH